MTAPQTISIYITIIKCKSSDTSDGRIFVAKKGQTTVASKHSLLILPGQFSSVGGRGGVPDKEEGGAMGATDIVG